MPYMPGTHVIASLSTTEKTALERYGPLKQALDGWIDQYGLHRLGEVYHDFIPEGFTAVVCLSESHVSVHTWPEYGKVNLDIYLSNHERDNDGTVQALFKSFEDWFKAKVTAYQIIRR